MSYNGKHSAGRNIADMGIISTRSVYVLQPIVNVL